MELVKAMNNIYLLAGLSVFFTACNIQNRQNDGHSDLTAEVRPLNPIVWQAAAKMREWQYPLPRTVRSGMEKL